MINKTASLIVAAIMTFILLLTFMGFGKMFETDTRNLPFVLIFVIAFSWFYKTIVKREDTGNN